MCSIHFTKKCETKLGLQRVLNYSPKNRRKILNTAIPTLLGPLAPHKTGHSPLAFTNVLSHNSLSKKTPDKSGSSNNGKCVMTSVPLPLLLPVKHCKKNLFNVSLSASRNINDSDIQSLKYDASTNNDNSGSKIDSSNDLKACRKCQCVRYKSQKQIWEKKFLTLSRKYEKLSNQLKLIKDENLALQGALKARNEDQKIVETLKTIFTPGQIKKLVTQTKRIQWSAEDIASAISLRSISPKAYKYLREKCQYPLPDLSTLRRWASTFSVDPGVLKDVSLLMKKKAKILNETSRLTVLSFDEMYIDKQYCFHKEKEQVFGPHRAVQVVMARGLCSPWKQPIYYNFDTPMTRTLLLHIIKTLYECDYTVVAIVCDMGSQNLGLWRELNINISKSFFQHPNDESKLVFAFADVPHLLKLLRNHFIDSGFCLNNKNYGKKYIEDAIELGTNNNLRIGHKVTQDLLDVKRSQRQKVKSAAKLFSYTTAKLLDYCGENKLIQCSNFKTLSDFIELVNNWFDLLNTSSKYSAKGVSAFGVNLNDQMKIIQKMTEVMTAMRVVRHRALLPFQKGIIITNKSLEGLYHYLVTTYNLEYIMTRRLNQDVLENFFSNMRSMGAVNTNPDAISFMYRLRWYILGKNSSGALTQSKNCEEDEDDKLTNPLQDHEEQQEVCLTAPLFASIVDTSSSFDIDTELNCEWIEIHFVDDPSLCEGGDSSIITPEIIINHEGLRYLTGYVAHRFRTKYPHLGNSSPDNDVPSTSTSNLDWINFISKGNLLHPTKEFLQVAEVMEATFVNFHGADIQKVPKIITTVVNEVKNNINTSKFPDEVIRCLVRTRTYIRIRELNKSIIADKSEVKCTKKIKQIVGKH